jgi:uncharacterized protein (TIGR01777 family)
MTSLRVTVSGASGLIGTALCRHLTTAGHEVTRLVRRPAAAGEATWDPVAGTLDRSAIDGADAVVHLAGAGIGDHRWTDDYRRTLRDSRIRSAELLAAAITEASRPPRVLLSGSAVGIYGDSETATFTETSPPGDGFLPELCRDWEAAATPAAQAGTRVVFLRSGLVLSSDGGVLPKLALPVRLFAGGRYGSGRHWHSWITIDDEVRAIVHLLASEVSGPVNLTSPQPVTNRDLIATLGKVLRRPTVLPAPKLPLRLVLGRDRADTLLFEGQRVMPQVLLGDGFVFTHPELEPALRRVLAR